MVGIKESLRCRLRRPIESVAKTVEIKGTETDREVNHHSARISEANLLQQMYPAVFSRPDFNDACCGVAGRFPESGFCSLRR